ncbi:CGNR zinc finger domain-containing protein [Nonomuraea glycinis]|uniref:CGNR zinc finger domain-containing protein n=1 Tax=Nonomuraea glycinis TaxID=2047744 RepID=UPI002E0F5584|nr:ABATE domain-containing protein [Nonomuraea glycinis]
MGFVFVSGDLALDLAGTLKWRRSDPEELLVTPADLARWTVEAGVLSDEPPVDAAGLRRTRALREVVYRLVRHGMDGLPWPEDDLRELNRAAAGPTPRMALTTSGLSRTGDIAAVAAEVARAAIALLAGLDRLRVRECGHPDCTRVYIDRSRAGNRQWCGMEECGNRVKAANYRSRKARSVSA